MPERLYTYADGLEYRAADNSGPGVLTGPVVIYGDVATAVRKGPERFLPGAWGDVVAQDWTANLLHQRNRTIAWTGGGGLTLLDGRDALRARVDLPDTVHGRDAALLARKGVLRGLSAEFDIIAQRYAADGVRDIERAQGYAVGLVDDPAYKESTLEIRRDALEYRRRLTGRFDYNTPTVTADRGRQRKESVVPGAFAHGLADETREILLTLGERADRPIASRSAGTLIINDTPVALEFEVADVPDTSYAQDFLRLLSAGSLAYGVRALYRIPPPETVPDATAEVPDTAPDAAPGVTILNIHQAILTGLAIIPRAPRGNPGEVSTPPAGPETRRRLLLLL